VELKDFSLIPFTTGWLSMITFIFLAFMALWLFFLFLFKYLFFILPIYLCNALVLFNEIQLLMKINKYIKFIVTANTLM
jgi:hypothetical protein